MRHRKALNRINMPGPRRRAAVRSMVDGLLVWEHIDTTDARAKVAQREAEKLIALAIRGHNRSWDHLNVCRRRTTIWPSRCWVWLGADAFASSSRSRATKNARG